jgi:hypothetical protein
MTFVEAVQKARGTFRVVRQQPSWDGKLHRLRELQMTADGVLYVRAHGSEEQRHITLADVQATDWRQTL